jgi:hypothetical protein
MIRLIDLVETKIILKKIPFNIVYPKASHGYIPKEWGGNLWTYPGSFIKISEEDYIEFVGLTEIDQKPSEYQSGRGDVLIEKLKKAGIPYKERYHTYIANTGEEVKETFICVKKRYFDVKVTLGETKVAPRAAPFILFPNGDYYNLFYDNDPSNAPYIIADFNADKLKNPYLTILMTPNTMNEGKNLNFLLKKTRGLPGVKIQKEKRYSFDIIRFEIPIKYFEIKNYD